MATPAELLAELSANKAASTEETTPAPAAQLAPIDTSDSLFDLSPQPVAGAAPGSGVAVPPQFLPSAGDQDVGPKLDTNPDFMPALMQGALQSLKSLGGGLEAAGSGPPELTGLGVEDFLQRKAGAALEGFAGKQLAKHPELQRPERLKGGVVDMLKDPSTRWDYVQRILGENIPNVGAFAVTAATGFKLGGPIGVRLAAQQFSKTLESGGALEELEQLGVEPEEARQTAEAVGLVNSLLDVAPIGKIFNDIPGLRKAWDSHITSELLNPSFRTVVKQTITTGLLESGTEGTQEIVLNFAKSFYDKNQDLLEGVDEAMFAGLILGGGTHATVAAVDAVLPSETERIPTIPEELSPESMAAAEAIMQLQEDTRQPKPGKPQLQRIAKLPRNQDGSVNAEALAAELPPVPEGMIRMYRASSPSVKFEDVFDVEQLADKGFAKPEGLKGDHWTPAIAYADYFLETYGKDATLQYMDYPGSVALERQVNTTDFILDPNEAVIESTAPEKPLTPENSTIADTEAIQLDEAEAQWQIEENKRSALAQFRINMQRADVEIDEKTLDDLSGALDQHNVALDLWSTLNQLIKRNKHIQGLSTPQLDGSPGLQQNYELMMGVAHDGEKHAEKRAKQLNRLSPQQSRAWSEVMLERSLQSENLGRKLRLDEEQKIMDDFGLDEHGMEMLERIDRDFSGNLDQLFDTMFSSLLKKYPEGGAIYDTQLAQLNKDINNLRNRNFFPFSRFGKFLVTIFAKQTTEHEGKKVRKGSKILEEAYPTEAEAKEAAAFWKKQNVGQKNTVALDKRTDNDLNFTGLPSIMLNKMVETMNLDQEQLDSMAKIKEEFSPGQGFRKRLLKRKGVAGYSRDSQKAYMSYQLQFTRFLAKLKYREDIDAAIDQIEHSAHQITIEGGNAIARRDIVKWLRQHRDYVFNPGPEWAMWRSVSFMWYLAAIPEKVVLNLMQLPTVVYPHLAAKYGDAKAVKAMAKASNIVWDMWRHPEKVDPQLAEALRESQRQGHTDQSFAVEAAAMAESKNLARFSSAGLGGDITKAWAKISEVGTYLFAKSELVNRRTAFIAGWLLEMEKSGDINRAWVAAKNITREGAFVFARHNRAKFMRGRKSSLFVFWQHWQQYMNFVFQGDPAAYRGLIMLIAIVGINGLPGAETMWELTKFITRQYNKQAGREVLNEDPKKWARQQYKEMTQMIVDDPDGVLAAVTFDGASKYGFGLPWMGEQIGVPIPSTDMSASLSLGRIPMLNDLLSGMNTTGSFATALERTVTGVGGAGYGIPLSMAKAMTKRDTDPLNTLISVAPRWAAYPAKAYQRFANGGSQYRGGGTVPGSEIDPQNPWHLAEIIAQASGFPSTRENLAKERAWNKREAVLYWNTRRQMILTQLWEIYKGGDVDLQGKRESIADMKKAQKAFNGSVPFKGLKISPADVRRAVYGKKRDIILKELGLPASLRARQIFEDEEGTVISEEAIPGSSKR